MKILGGVFIGINVVANVVTVIAILISIGLITQEIKIIGQQIDSHEAWIGIVIRSKLERLRHDEQFRRQELIVHEINFL